MTATQNREHTDAQNRESQLVPEMEAADLLGLSIRTLQNWRVRGGGPRFVRISARCIRYRIADIEEWIAARTCANTSEPVSD